MINSKNQLIKALKSGEKIIFKTIQHEYNPSVISIERVPGTQIRTNAFTIATDKNGQIMDSWVYLKDIDIKNGMIFYKNFDIQIQIKN